MEGAPRRDDDGTGDGMVVADIDQGRLGRGASGLRQRAASDQPAGIGRINRAGDLADQPQPRPRDAPLGDRRRREQRACVGMLRGAEDALRRADLDDPTQVHHRDTVGDVADDLQVVADEEIGQVQPLLQLEQEVEDLARTETSSDEVGSSRMTISGETPSPRAIPTRWRCPPLSSCG